MRKLNLIVVFDKDLNKVLFCIRAKEPYKGMYNFVGGKVEEGETNDEAAYRELFEETGISKKDIKLEHFMDLNYFKYGNNLQVYYGILKHDVILVEEKNKLEWVTINDELLDIKKFAGNYNIPHIITQIKVYLKNGVKIDNYSKEQEKEYGVIGIKIDLLSNSFRYTYNKLVRDKIPENIDREQGRKCKYRILDDIEYLKELNRKVLEEANEFIEENSIEELGDLIEVINAIMKLKGYNMKEVEEVMKSKEYKKGAFNNKIFLEYVDEEKRNLKEEKELEKDFRKDNWRS